MLQHLISLGEPQRARHTSHVTILLAAVISGATMAPSSRKKGGPKPSQTASP